MMRLIDADALERKLMVMPDEDLCEGCCYNVVNAIAEMPTVDAVPVVKCKDCVYFDKHNGTNDWNGWCDKDEIYAILSDEFYCGFAERKVEE